MTIPNRCCDESINRVMKETTEIAQIIESFIKQENFLYSLNQAKNISLVDYSELEPGDHKIS